MSAGRDKFYADSGVAWLPTRVWDTPPFCCVLTKLLLFVNNVAGVWPVVTRPPAALTVSCRDGAGTSGSAPTVYEGELLFHGVLAGGRRLGPKLGGSRGALLRTARGAPRGRPVRGAGGARCAVARAGRPRRGKRANRRSRVDHLF